MSAIPSTTIQIPFTGGLNQKADARAKQTPALDICKDVQFDSIGGLQTRYPYANIGSNILGGGTLSNIRRLVANNNELLCFTVDTLYSWNVQLSVWVPKGSHLAATVDETTVFQDNGDQFDCDVASLSGVTVYSWCETLNGSNIGIGYLGAIDNASGQVIMASTVVTPQLGSGKYPRIRLIALQTRILAVGCYGASANLAVLAIDPANVAASVATTWTTLGTSGPLFDACPVIGADQALVLAQDTTSDYILFTVTSGLTIASSTKARTNDAAIAVACSPDGLHAAVVRTSTTSVVGDLILISTLADVHINVAIGTTTSSDTEQIAACFAPVQVSGKYRCWVWYTNNLNTTTSQVGFDDSGTQFAGPSGVTVQYYWPLASRAFVYNGSVYVWGMFAEANGNGFSIFGGALQNTYYLQRNDGFWAAKAAAGNAGGLIQSQSRLPGVQLVGGTTQFQWCGSISRIVNVTNAQGYASRAPRSITFTFDDQNSRRCVRIGKTLYIAGGIGVLQYDGVSITELGWPISPWAMSPIALGSGGHLSAGGYGVKATYRCDNAQGERDRSTTTNVATVTCVSSDEIETGVESLTMTRRSSVAIEVWRTIVNPIYQSPYYLATAPSPQSGGTTNLYLANDPTATGAGPLLDVLSDASISVLENNPENGAVLPNVCAPAARVIFASDARIFLGDIAGDADTIWYSQTRNDGEVCKFNDSLTFKVPSTGGSITAINPLPTGAVVVHRQTATYVFEGTGFDNTGNGQNFQLTRTVATDIGAQSQEAVVLLDTGLLFKSNKGWYQIDLSQSLTYVGGPISGYDSETILATHVTTAQHQVRILSAQRLAIYDWLVQQWGEWTIAGGVDAVMWGGAHLYTDGSTVYQQQTTFAGVTYGMDVETAWIKMNDLQGDGRVRRLLVLGEYRGEHALQWRVARDYQYDGAGNVAYMDNVVLAVTPTLVGSAEQCGHGPSSQQCQSIKVRLTAVDATNSANPPTGEALRLTGIALKVGVRPTPFPRLPAAQKV